MERDRVLARRGEMFAFLKPLSAIGIGYYLNRKMGLMKLTHTLPVYAGLIFASTYLPWDRDFYNLRRKYVEKYQMV